ncbi:MAG: hypothetical protein Q9227_008433 [Pyrenula ochraceoflavens]
MLSSIFKPSRSQSDQPPSSSTQRKMPSKRQATGDGPSNEPSTSQTGDGEVDEEEDPATTTPRPSTEKPLPSQPKESPLKQRLQKLSCLPTLKSHANRLSTAYSADISSKPKPKPTPNPSSAAAAGTSSTSSAAAKASKIPHPTSDERRLFKHYTSTRDALAKAEAELERQVARVVELKERKDDLYGRLVRSVTEGKRVGDEGWESRVPGIVGRLEGAGKGGVGEREGEEEEDR